MCFLLCLNESMCRWLLESFVLHIWVCTGLRERELESATVLSEWSENSLRCWLVLFETRVSLFFAAMYVSWSVIYRDSHLCKMRWYYNSTVLMLHGFWVWGLWALFLDGKHFISWAISVYTLIIGQNYFILFLVTLFTLIFFS